MSKEIYISSTPHETRLAIVENDDLTEIYYERENEYTLAGSIYNGKVTRVLPGMQSSFVDIGLERDAFLYITDFMEEAGDSAEFDSAGAGSGARRTPREDRGGSREDRGGSREDRSPRDEPIALPDESAVSQERLAAPSAEVSGDRNDRERGRRRRGSRDGRPGNREGGANPDERAPSREPRAEIRTSSTPIESSFDAPPVVQSGFLEPGADTSSAELGEGAPGADGSRRWRGRRGRNSAQRDESQVLQQPGASPEQADPGSLGRGYQADSTNAEETEEIAEENIAQEYNDSDGSDDGDGSFDLHASAPAPSASPQAATDSPQDRLPTPSTSSSDNSRDRGGDRNRRDRGGRDRDGRTPRAPRGFAPSRALYGVDSASDSNEQADAPIPEPIVLPGESLSKYRKGDDAQGSSGASASSESSIPAPRPSTEFSLQGTWDGGNVLPGETIRPRSNVGLEPGSSGRSGSDRPNEVRGQRDRGSRDDRRGRDDRSDHCRDGRPETREDRNRSSSQAAPRTPASFRNETSPATARVSEPETSVNPSASEQRKGSAEYEPTEASASVRFDPTSRSEFRQSAASVELSESLEPGQAEPEVGASSSSQPGEIPKENETEAGASGLTPGSLPSKEPSPQAAGIPSIAHTITPQPETPVAPIHVAPIHLDAPTEAAPSHEFTSIQNTGDMLSDAPAPPPGEIAEPTSPLQHETAVLEAVAQPESPVPTPSGQLEEEVMEDEDFSDMTLHASSIEEMDYEEEETLEGAADLGTMIREMSIDQITRPGEDPEEEEDDLEEEDAVDDHLDDSFEGRSEEGQGEEENDEGEEPESFDEHAAAGERDQPSHRSPGEHGYTAAGDRSPANGTSANGDDASREPDRRSSRRDGGRRDNRRGDRGRDRGGDRARSTGGSGDRSTSRPGRRDGRHSAQVTNLPAISDLLKPGQEVLVQIAKEPIAKKGARITSHIALPGRFLVFMPTVHHTGVSRKIESDGERRRLKEILLSEKGEASGGFIVRTAASGASEEELRSDLRFLLNLWADIKQRSESSKSPALIYHDLNLVERVLRDQVTDTFSAIWVDTETEYERVLRFLQRFQPSLIRRVKLYTKDTPLFEQFGINEEINKALRSKVWLKSGGSIVINQTEALVAIDINTGKFVGKTARLEDTIVKTNLDAIPEIVRQIRLRDLGGIIIIDFIDMDERKNRHKVMAALEEELKHDRAPSKVLQFNDFGLVAITRKRVKQSLERTLSTTCNVCQGTGMTKSPVTVCNDIYIEMRKMQKHLDRGDVMLRVNPEVVKQLKATGTRWLQEMEEMVGKTILVKSDPSLHPEQFDIH